MSPAKCAVSTCPTVSSCIAEVYIETTPDVGRPYDSPIVKVQLRLCGEHGEAVANAASLARFRFAPRVGVVLADTEPPQ